MPLSRFHPAVIARWFRETLGEPTAAQRRGWAAIREGRHTLIAAPTGSGKTLAAFLTALDDLVREGLRAAAARRSARRLRVAAQGAERRHPQEPRGAAARHPPARRASWGSRRRGSRPRCAPATRPQAERAAMLRTPPHILVTTPGVAVPAAHRRAQPRDAADRAHGDRRRDPRGDRHAARRAPRAVARAAAATSPTRRCCASGCRRRRSRSTRSRASSSARATSTATAAPTARSSTRAIAATMDLGARGAARRRSRR